MSWNLDSDRPIFLQIMERIKTDIVSGALPPGSKVPSVRELASEASVNPNTMQQALSELERMGLMHSERTSGRYITEDTAAIDSLRSDLASECSAGYIKSMKRIGYSEKEMIRLIKEHIKEE